MKTILVTGSSGLIGSAFIDRIGESVVEIGLDRAGPPHPPPATEHVIECDLTSDASVEQAMNAIRDRGIRHIDSAVHLAAYYSFSGQPSPLYEQVTVRGTERLIRGLRDFTVGQFIFSSTMLVHASTLPGKPIDEHWPLEPRWAYPQSKVETEQLIIRERGDMPVVLLRVSGVYDDYCHSIPIAHQISRIHRHSIQARLFPGDLRHGQSFVHLDDLLDALVMLIDRREQLPPVLPLLLGEPEAFSYDSLQRQISRHLFGYEINTLRIPKPAAKLGAWVQDVMPGPGPFIKPWMIDLADDHYELDISLARELLDWQPRHSLMATVPRMIELMKADPARWYAEHSLGSPPEENRPAWPHVANMMLGLWLIGSAPALGAESAFAVWNDVTVGVLAMLLGVLAIRREWAAWATAVIGTWLMFAPLLFSARSAVVYNNDMLVGSLLVLFALVFTRLKRERPGLGLPPGWSYNPSGWEQRLGIVFLAIIGFLLARYMAAFQLGHIPYPWDPFFGEGTRRILTSDISEAFRISDAGLGAASYLVDAIAGLIGGRRRWRTMPWMVLLFGLLIVPPGVTSIVLVILQPVGVGDWCTLCLLAAAIMLFMVPPAIDEVIASIQFVARRRREGHGIWRTIWLGDNSEQQETQPTSSRSPLGELIHGIEVFSAPWNLWLATAIGAWLMAAPSVLDVTGAAADMTHIIGALVATFSVVAFAEPARSARLLNLPLAGWLVVAAWTAGGGNLTWTWTSTLAALVLAAVSLPRGRFEDRYGGWERFVR